MDQNISSALGIVDRLQDLLSQVERHFKSARTWSIIDVFGGGFFTDLVKYSEINNAQSLMGEVNYLLRDLQSRLKTINIPSGMDVHMNGFVTFADFVFDGFFIDAYVASEIFRSLDEVHRLQERLREVKMYLRIM